MSILIPDLKIYQAVATKMYYATSNPVCDINHFTSCFSFRSPLTEEKIWTLINHWLALNEASYYARYKEPITSPLTEFLKKKFIYDAPNTYQFLKWLQCIRYNIEPETIKKVRQLTVEEALALNFLDRLIREAQDAIINSLTQYKEAKWSENN